TITLDSGQGPLNLSTNMTITGPGAGAVTISGNNAVQVFIVTSVTTLGGVTIAGGSTSNVSGGGIANAGTLTVTNCTLSGNSTTGLGSGGGITNNGRLAVTNSTFSGNSAGTGGGITNEGGTVTVTGSIFTGNSALNGGAGGGLYNG